MSHTTSPTDLSKLIYVDGCLQVTSRDLVAMDILYEEMDRSIFSYKINGATATIAVKPGRLEAFKDMNRRLKKHASRFGW
jgi:hypothetical protein